MPDNHADYIAGEELFQKRARSALPLLVRQVSARAPIYYSDLARELGMPNPRNLNFVLGYVGTAVERLGKSWNEVIPPIQCVVINKEEGLPGAGVGYFVQNVEEFHKLPRKDQQRLLDLELNKIWQFNKWSNVLHNLGLEPAGADYSKLLEEAEHLGPTQESRGPAFGNGGESQQHQRLKKFVANHPEVLGLPRGTVSNIEHSLKSGDILDVHFQVGKDRIAAEVKSSISHPADVVRGIFQCVKYRSILEAEQAAEQLAQSARAILVLEAELPKDLLALKYILNVEIFENIKPH